MGCQPGDDVTKENIGILKEKEEDLEYPPRFRFKFTCIDERAALTDVTAIFTGSVRPLKVTIELVNTSRAKTIICMDESGIAKISSHTFTLKTIDESLSDCSVSITPTSDSEQFPLPAHNYEPDIVMSELKLLQHIINVQSYYNYIYSL